MYKIKKSILRHVAKYAKNSSLDLNGSYTKEVWNKNGFKDSILEKSNMQTKKLYQRSKIFNTMLSMYGQNDKLTRMTRKEALIAVLITNGIINTPEEYDWREHRGYYSCAFSAYGCDHFYNPLKGTKTRKEDSRYLIKDTDEKGKTTYILSGEYYVFEEYRSARVAQPEKTEVNTTATPTHGTRNSPVTEIPKTKNTSEQTQYEKSQYLESLTNYYKAAILEGNMELAKSIHHVIMNV